MVSCQFPPSTVKRLSSHSLIIVMYICVSNGKWLPLLVGLLSRTGTNMMPTTVIGPGSGDEWDEEVAFW